MTSRNAYLIASSSIVEKCGSALIYMRMRSLVLVHSICSWWFTFGSLNRQFLSYAVVLSRLLVYVRQIWYLVVLFSNVLHEKCCAQSFVFALTVRWFWCMYTVACTRAQSTKQLKLNGSYPFSQRPALFSPSDSVTVSNQASVMTWDDDDDDVRVSTITLW